MILLCMLLYLSFLWHLLVLALFDCFILSQSYLDKIYSYYVYLQNYALYVAT